MTSHEIRNKFIRYFETLDHQVITSSPVIPAEDPTILYTNAGMNQFKDVFLGLDKRPYNRAVSVQKCIRAGGKHNDLELVGKTARHLTFFEMLGNFSFGDYFKEEAIQYAWHFFIGELGLPPEKLWVSVFTEDSESEKIWKEGLGLPAERIYRMGEKDNFWSMGDVGPCGPCSEIGIDQGLEFGCDRPDCDVGCECDRYLELWNLVFMQYNRDESGKLNLLPKPSVDTGMGLERISSVMQGVPSNFETDLLMPLIDHIGTISGVEYRGENKSSFRVIADHIRALLFAIVDGVVPSNEGRGYVLRRILRRAARHGRLLGINSPFLNELVPDVVRVMGSSYPEVMEGVEGAVKVIRGEEERFGLTLDQGLSLFEKVVAELGHEKMIPGEKVFLLYDTFGFPPDLTAGMAEERGLGIDRDGFEREMERQRTRARGEKEGYEKQDLQELGLEPAVFVGYQNLAGKGKVQRIEVSEQEVDEAAPGEEVAVDLTSTSFYGESGGQVGDRGLLEAEDVVVEINETRVISEGRIVHSGKIKSGVLRVGQEVESRVDEDRRMALKRSHTATHLLHYALRKVLGAHVKQSGSMVSPDRFRFDFTHYSPVSREELLEVEKIVQDKILSNSPVTKSEMPIAEAKEKGALAFFGEKYGENVRVVDIDGYSVELCGGTHLSMTGEIGTIMTVSESSISAGIRRIEALVGIEAFKYGLEQKACLEDVLALLKVPREKITKRIEELKEEVRTLQRDMREYTLAKARDELKIDVKDVVLVNEIPLLVRKVDVPDIDSLRRLADEVRDKLETGVGVLGAVIEKKAMLIVTVSKNLIQEKGLGAPAIINEIAGLVGGRGGGKPEMAQAGGKNWEKLDSALGSAEKVIRNLTG